MTDTMHDALLALGQSIADAALAGLHDGIAETASVSEVTTLVDSHSLSEHIVSGVVVADAGSLDGAAGRSLLVISPDHARALAGEVARSDGDEALPATPAAAPATDPDDDEQPPPVSEAAEPTSAPEDEEPPEAFTPAPAPQPASAAVTELPAAVLDAVSRVADGVNRAAANSLTILLGQPVRYEDARAAIVEDPRFVVRPGPVQAVCVALEIGEVDCKLIQFAPNALVMRAARAFEDLAQDAAGRMPGMSATGPSVQTLNGIRLRVWAELGRTERGLADALSLPLGTVVELDRDADAPVDLVVNGMRFGSGRLIVTDEGEWALALDEVGPVPAV